MKEYKTYELKYYVISCVFAFFWFHFKNSFQTDIELSNLADIWSIINPILASPIFYIFTILLDSLYSSDAKFKIIFFITGKPSGRVFAEISTEGCPPWFSKNEAKKAYSDILKNIKACDKYSNEYQEREWYKIYSKYREKSIESLDISAKEYRLNRDLNIATLNLILIYLAYALASKNFCFEYIVFLIIMFVITNMAARNKGKRWVYNVISYDINHG